jgi:OpgC protein
VTPLLKFSGPDPDRSVARFLDAACLGYVIWWFPRTIDQRLMRLRLFSFFNLLGRHSLQVFAFSLLICTPLWEAPSHYWAGMSGSARVVVAIVTVLSLAIPARLHEMYRELRLEKAAAGVKYPAILRASPKFVVSANKEPA